MKTPTCRNCKSGIVTLDNPAIVSKPLSMTCWMCGGTAYKGMSVEQVKWHRTQWKALEASKKDMHRNKQITELVTFLTMKGQVNKACVRLGITMQSPQAKTATWRHENQAYLNLQAEMKELERRLVAISTTMAAATTAVKAA